MKLRIHKAVVGIFKQKPCMVVELNKYDYERALAYNKRDLDGYVIEITKKKRSNDQNRYMWELISQIAERSGISQNDIYRQAIREAGAWYTFKVRQDEYKSFCKTWEENGVGWWVETEVYDHDGVMCRAYRGTSGYNSAEMSRIIDWVVNEAKWYEIDTETPEQLARRKAIWNENI